MTLIIPLLSTPSQTLAVTLGTQPVKLHVYEKTTGLFVDLYVNDALVVGGVVARNGVRIVRDAYLGFTGDLLFADTQGAEDPQSSGLGTRWVLAYVDA